MRLGNILAIMIVVIVILYVGQEAVGRDNRHVWLWNILANTIVVRKLGRDKSEVAMEYSS